MQVNYKQKYEDLKQKFINSMDVSFNLGYEQGLQAAQLEQAQQQQQQQMALDQQAAAGQPGQDQPGQPGQDDAAQPGAEDPTAISQNPQGDELDQHIEKLESMLGKSEISSSELQDLKKTLGDIRSLQTQINLNKSLENIRNIKMNKSYTPLNLTPKVKANLPEPASKALSLQEKIVSDIFKKWESDQSRASNDISSILNIEGITKKE